MYLVCLFWKHESLWLLICRVQRTMQSSFVLSLGQFFPFLLSFSSFLFSFPSYHSLFLFLSSGTECSPHLSSKIECLSCKRHWEYNGKREKHSPISHCKLEGKYKHTILTQFDESYARMLFLNFNVCSESFGMLVKCVDWPFTILTESEHLDEWSQ